MALAAPRRGGRVILAGTALVVGYAAGVASTRESMEEHRELPSGWPHSCAVGMATATTASAEGAAQLTAEQRALPQKLARRVGSEHVITDGKASAAYTRGARIGDGRALAVVRPGTLSEAVDVLQLCVDAGVAVLPQGANTGLTGGSVPRADDGHGGPPRPTVVVNMRRLKRITPIDGGKRLVCLAGAGIRDAAEVANGFGRESHSVLGSIFLNPTVAAGVAFGSGGTQVRKGPVFTERALYCRVDENGKVQIVNTTGIRAPSNIHLFAKLQEGMIEDADVDPGAARVPAHDASYAARVCAVEDGSKDKPGSESADSGVARFNADTHGLEVNRSEGKVLILATVHDTFAKPRAQQTMWIACRDLDTAQRLRREVLLASAADLPTACEYMDRDSFDVVDGAGRVLCLLLRGLGISERLSTLMSLKSRVEALPLPFADIIPDKIMYLLNRVAPAPLPAEMMELARGHDHNLLLNVGDFGDGGMERLEKRLGDFVEAQPEGAVTVHRCSERDARLATYVRFACAPAFRTWCVGRGSQGVSVDYALRKDDAALPALSLAEEDSVPVPVTRMRYSHFGCNVVHEDLEYARGADTHAAKMAFKRAVEARGGRLPAEHGHGTEYHAPPDAQGRWKQTDPTNSLNPGVGGLPVEPWYGAKP